MSKASGPGGQAINKRKTQKKQAYNNDLTLLSFRQWQGYWQVEIGLDS